MGKVIYFTGGARSGKSLQAERYILNNNYISKIYVATSIPFDEEMRARVEKHREQRGEDWITIEAYRELIKKLTPFSKKGGVVLLDCLTNMVSNLMILEKKYDWDTISMSEIKSIENGIEKEVRELLEFVKREPIDMVIVSNEIGMGIIPAYPLGRYFRDICGKINQLAAEYSDEAYMAVSGLQLQLK